MKRKTWNKSAVKEIICGYCDYCGKELLNTMGGWIVTENKLHFCPKSGLSIFTVIKGIMERQRTALFMQLPL
jgi:hypothetical protein